ncbi:MAG: diguanylate cyclase domain-containing protein, partial [Halothiobacillaceae bacterium]
GFGHLAGDHLLQEVAQRLQGLCRESDTVARLGGDEFVILLPGSHTGMEAGVVARKVIQAMGQPFPLDGQSVTIGTSIGIALWPEHAQGPEELIAAADRAMYAAKKAGRGGFRLACARDHAPPRSEPDDSSACPAKRVLGKDTQEVRGKRRIIQRFLFGAGCSNTNNEFRR